VTRLGAAITEKLEARPRAVLALSLALVVLIGAADLRFRYDFSFVSFYIVPVVLAARFIGLRAAVGVWLLAGAFGLADYLYNWPGSLPTSLTHWNTSQRFGAVLIAAFVVARLKESVRREHRQVLHEHDISMAKSEMLSLVSHQYNNALTSMKLALTLLQDPPKVEDAPDPDELYRIIASNISTLQLLTQSFLNEARLASGRFALEIQATPAAEAVRDVVSALKPLSAHKHVEIDCLVAPGLQVSADRDALNVVLTNLIGNAIKYTASGGRVTVLAGPAPEDSGFALFTVEDTGLGMSKEELRSILQGFHRTTAARKAAPGFGIGLKVTSDLLHSHGSRLTVESNPGQGSKFSFLLPRRNA
jgi:signal transduction histidine kinase